MTKCSHKAQQIRSNPFGNLCQHSAYADLCITCHPVECDVVAAAIEETTRLNVAKVDRDAR